MERIRTFNAVRAAWEVNNSAEKDEEQSEILEGSNLNKLTNEDLDNIDPEIYKKLSYKYKLEFDPDSNNFVHEGSRLVIGIYEDVTNGDIIVSFIGYDNADKNNGFKRDSWKGWHTDLAYAFNGEDPHRQFELSKEVGIYLRDQLGDRIIFTGQSLGGALASYAGINTGVKTITFNALGLHEKGTFNNIKAYNVKGEFLWYYQDKMKNLPQPVGEKIYLEPADMKWYEYINEIYRITLHSPDRIIPALYKYYKEGGGK